MLTEITYKEHLAWCKERAIECCETGDVAGAWASMLSDLHKHPATKDHVGIEIGNQLFISGHLTKPADMQKFIEDFN